MGRTYRGLSKKDRESLKRSRLQRHKREIRDEEESNDGTFNRKENRRPKNDVGRNISDDERYYSDEE